MGQRDAFSMADVAKINQMYKCSNVDATTTVEPKPPMNAHNNINELVGEIDETTPIPPSSPTTGRPSAPNRPNRPFLNILGNLIGNALANQGK